MDKKKIEKKEYLKLLFWLFLIGSIFGTYFEEIRHIIWYFKHKGVFNYSARRGVLWGPLSPVYGIGAVTLALFLNENEKSYVKTFLKATILGGAVEYILSLIQELFTGMISWDYSHKPFNIGGRTNLLFMIGWGFIGIIFIKFIYPYIKKILGKIPKNIYDKLTMILFVIVTIDIIISWSVLYRQVLRHKNIEPITVVGKVYDKYFDDDYMTRKFPNMRPAKKH